MRVRATFTLLADSGEEIQPGTFCRCPTQDFVWAFLEAAVDCVGEPVTRLEIATELDGVPSGYDQIEVPLFHFVIGGCKLPKKTCTVETVTRIMARRPPRSDPIILTEPVRL